jgi:transcriptional regulator with XRE-family HTH domain
MGRMARRSFPTLYAWRDDAKLSQAEAAKLMDITQSHWSNLESRESAASPKLAKRLSELTGVPLEVLLKIDDPDSGASSGNQQKEYIENTHEKPNV